MVLCTKTHLRGLAISCYLVDIADRFSDFPPNLSSIVRVPDWRDENLRVGWSTWSWPVLVCKSFISANELSLPAWAEIDSLNQNLKISHTCHIGSLHVESTHRKVVCLVEIRAGRDLWSRDVQDHFRRKMVCFSDQRRPWNAEEASEMGLECTHDAWSKS